MASTRFGHLDDFTLNNTNVGIGTSTPQDKMEVIGGTRSTDLRVSGIATFTSPRGFIEKHLEYNAVEDQIIIDAGDSGTLSGEIVVGSGKTMAVGTGATTSQGTVDALKVYDMFQPPSGTTNQRPPAKTGAIFYNFDFKTIEFFDGNSWRQVDNTTRSGRAVVAGGENPAKSSNIDFFNISTNGNANRFGELSTTIAQSASCSSRTRGLFAGGTTPSLINNIEYITIQSEGGSIDFGDLTLARRRMTGGGLSSSTRGIFASGFVPSGSVDVNIIEYVEIATIGNSLDFGDLSVGSWYVSSFSSPTRGVITEGSDLPTMEFITISSKGNSVSFGDSTVTTAGRQSCSNAVRGITAGGYGSGTTPGIPLIRSIEFVTIASSGNGQVFGDLTRSTAYGQATSSNTRGVFTGGYATVGGGANESNTIDFVVISSAGSAADFGDLTEGKAAAGACSDSHGGLGGY